MINSDALAKIVTSFLAPAVPYMLKGRDQAWGEASKKMGADAWDLSKAIWRKLLDSFISKSDGEQSKVYLLKTVTDLSNNPSDEDAQAAFRFQLKKIFKDDPELCSEVAKVIDDAKVSSAQTNWQSGGVNISGSTLKNVGNIVGGNQVFNGTDFVKVKLND
jgi:hypothetical protein